MDINSPPPAEVIDLAAKFAEVARASNGDGHEGGLGAPEPLAQLTRSLDAWSRSVQQAVHGVRERAEAVEHRLEGIQYELHGVKDDVRGVKDDVRGVKEQADGLALRAQESERQLLGIALRLDQQTSRADELARAVAVGAETIGRLDARAAALAGDIAALRQETAGLAAAHGVLQRRAGRLRAAVVLAFLALAGLAAWTAWPEVTRVVALLPMH